MGRGLGTKQQEMLSWLQEQWAQDIQPTRKETIEAFVVDSWTVFEWQKRTSRDISRQLERDGVSYSQAWLDSNAAIREHPDRPELTPRPVAEGYRRALRTLIDRKLIKVVADPFNRYRYTDPEADNPLRTVNNAGKPWQTITVNEECDRRREPKVSASEERRQALLKSLPADGSWIDIKDLLDAFWVAIGGEQKAIDEARAHLEERPWATYRLCQTNGYDWLRLALRQLHKQGKAEPGTIPWNSDAFAPKTEPQQKVLAARLSVA